MAYGFLKNESILDETHKVEDLFNFSDKVSRFESLLRNTPVSSTIGLIGPFGTGKSTMLHQLQKRQKYVIQWVEFNAWRYPDRKDLWEGFILEFAESIGEDKIKLAQTLDGIPSKGHRAVSGALAQVPGLQLHEFMKVFERTPIKRVYEYENILYKLIQSCDKDIVIIAEDIDRSDDQGIYFLQTLNHFLKKYKEDFSYKIQVVVPISDKNYTNRRDDYIKCLDYTESHIVDTVEFEDFLKKVIDDSFWSKQEHITTSAYPQSIKGEMVLSQIVDLMFEFYLDKKTSLRDIKYVLRDANKYYICQSHESPDWRITLVASVIKFYPDLQEPILKSRNIADKAPQYIKSYLWSLYMNSPMYKNPSAREELIDSLKKIRLVTRQDGDKEKWPSHPYIPPRMFSDNDSLMICDFYFK